MAASAEFRELILDVLRKLGDGGRAELCYLYDIECGEKPSAVQTAKELKQQGLLVIDAKETLNDFKKKLESLKRKDLGGRVDDFVKEHLTQNIARPPPRARDAARDQRPDEDSDDADDTEGDATANTALPASNSTTGTTRSRQRSSSEGIVRVQNVLRQRAGVARTQSSPGMVEQHRPLRSQGASVRPPTTPPIQEEGRPGSDSDVASSLGLSDGDNEPPDTTLRSLESYRCTVGDSDAAYQYLQADNATMRIGQGGAQEVQREVIPMMPQRYHPRDPDSLIAELASGAARVDVSIRIEHKGKKL